MQKEEAIAERGDDDGDVHRRGDEDEQWRCEVRKQARDELW